MIKASYRRDSNKAFETGRGATRYCVYGTCKSDSRNADEDYMMGVSLDKSSQLESSKGLLKD